MKDRKEPCIYYVNCGADCKRKFKNVTMEKCQHCDKYTPRKNHKKMESIRVKRQKDKDRHDNWKKEVY